MEFVPKIALRRKALRPGGKTAAEAIRAAEANLKKIETEIRAAVDETLRKIKELSEQYDGRDELTRKQLYDLSNTLIGMSKVAGVAPLGEAAYYLCDVLEGFAVRGHFNAEYIRVCTGGMWLLRFSQTDDRERHQILAGLRRVAELA